MQTIAQGPVASQVAIKILGVNGGGFFGANGAHPYENPTAITNFVQMFSILLLPSSLVFTFGKMAKHMKHALSLWMAMAFLCFVGVFTISYYEHVGNHLLASGLHLSSPVSMEGKEVRFGIFATSLFSNITTAASCGAAIASHSSLMPLSGMVLIINMLLNEVIFGGVGSGLYGMLIFVVLAVFIAGLMVGRTPDYLGKKIGAQEVKTIIIPIMGVSLLFLILLAISCISTAGYSSTGNPGPHGFSEMIYAYASTIQNNGSAFASLNANTPFWNYTTSLAMLAGRFLNLVPILALAGFMAHKKFRPQNANAFPTHGPLFVVLLIGIIVIVGALTYLPVIALGPVLEYFQLIK